MITGKYFCLNKLLCTVFLISLKCTIIFAQEELSAEKIYEKTEKSVVVVLAYDNKGNVYQGSGVVIDSSGLIATNHHVCKDASKIEIKHYSKEIKNVQVYVFDAVKDILILKTGDLSFSPITPGNSDNLKAGQRVYAVGSPEGYENSISEGIISGFRNDNNNVRLIQMTCPITDGSSGGAVLNSRGELIGLSVSGQHEGNLYFAVPVNDVFTLLGSMITSNTPVTETPADETPAVETQVVGSTVPEDLFESGTSAIENMDYSGAELYFSKHLEKFSSDVNAYYSRGYARFKLKEYKKAISDFSVVIEKSRSMESYFYRGNCYYSLKEYNNAREDYTKAIEQDPDNYDIFFNRGYASFKSGDFRGAISDWKKAIELNPEYSNELTPNVRIAEDELKQSSK
jgi:TolA-binding protein